MKRSFSLLFVVTVASFLMTVCAFSSFAQAPAGENPVVVMKTSLGTIEIELYPDKAPVTVANFLSYVNEAFYDSTIFHRVIPGFMIQGGGYTVNFTELTTKNPIKNEATNGLSNMRGTIAMARRPDINSATCQFFINHDNNQNLDHKDNTPQGYGYAVFGTVIKGMDVVDKIASVKTGTIGPFQNVPQEMIVIESLRLKK